jgi:hypothetical protein
MKRGSDVIYSGDAFLLYRPLKKAEPKASTLGAIGYCDMNISRPAIMILSPDAHRIGQPDRTRNRSRITV